MADPLSPQAVATLKRRASRAKRFPDNTCPASRHLHLIAQRLAAGKPYPMLAEEPQHCAETMLAVLASLWEARTKLAKLSGPRATGGPLSKADATALWHAVDAMRWNLRVMRDMNPEVQEHIPAETERHDAAKAALRKVQALVRSKASDEVPR